MSRRRLSKQQQKRIEGRQQQEIDSSQAAPDTGATRHHCNGRVISHFGQQLEVESLLPGDTGRVLRCHQRANLPALVTGDYVIWESGLDDTGVIVALGERDSLFARHDGSGREKPVAANIDIVLVVFAVLPEAFMNLIDRYIVAAESRGLDVRLVLNKTDLLDEENRPGIDNMLAIYEDLGYPVSRVSAITGAGIDALEQTLTAKTTLLVGQSGVGKSSLVNRLGPQELAGVGEISSGKYKGTHKTTTARLFHLNRCDLIDSPGIRELHLEQIDEADLLRGFRELRVLAERCRFRDCSHRSEPDCAIQQGLADGTVSAQRLESYFRILHTLTGS